MRRKKASKLQNYVLSIFISIILSAGFISVGYGNWIDNLKMDASLNTTSMDIVFKECKYDDSRICEKQLELNMGKIAEQKEYKYEFSVVNKNGFKFAFDNFELLDEDNVPGKIEIKEKNDNDESSINMVLSFLPEEIETIEDGKILLDLKFKNNQETGFWQDQIKIILDYSVINEGEIAGSIIEEDVIEDEVVLKEMDKESNIVEDSGSTEIDNNNIVEEQNVQEPETQNIGETVIDGNILDGSLSNTLDNQNICKEGFNNESSPTEDKKDI